MSKIKHNLRLVLKINVQLVPQDCLEVAECCPSACDKWKLEEINCCKKKVKKSITSNHKFF